MPRQILSIVLSRVDFHGGRHEKTKFTSLPSFRSGITARARTLASKGGLKSIRGWPVRWNHRVWETDRATRLDRMGSPAKWMREHYHSSLARKAWPGLLRELAQVNCTSFFRAAALRGIYWGPRSIFLGKNPSKIQSCAFRANGRIGVSLLLGALCKDTFYGRINAEMSIYLFSVENLMARVKSDFYCVS